jgi:hypothetical protein
MRISLRVRVLLVAALVTVAPNAIADIFGDIGKTIGDVATAGWRMTTAPYETVANTAQAVVGQRNPNTIFDPYRNAAAATGNAVGSVTAISNAPQQFIYSKVQEFANRTGGGAGDFIFDIATFNQRLMAELGAAGAYATANALRGQNPLQIVAAPLAGAIRAAHDKHYSNARPLPDDVKAGLAQFFPQNVLDRARYTQGNVDITLPNFIGQGHRFFGEDYAVVVDDVIVFNNPPPTFAEDPFWWGHEVMHVNQYTNWGIEQFAWNYVRDLGSTVEGEADASGSTIASRPPPVRQATQLGLTSALPGQQQFLKGQPQEFFVARCFFPNDTRPVQYLVTNTGKLIAVDPMSGQWMQFGWAGPPVVNGSAWTYRTMQFWYAVEPNGSIVMYYPNGMFQVVGYVQSLS